jgi:hypothetical protein
MRRDYYELDVRNTDWVDGPGSPERPVAVVRVDGPFDALSDRLTDPDGDLLDASGVDISFRYRDDTAGVFGITNRVTGEYILELNAESETIDRLVLAARRYADHHDDGGYTIDVRTDDASVVTYPKRTFLVYDRAGNLRREDSLIPGGVEL